MANTKTRKRFEGYSIYEGETEKEYQARKKEMQRWSPTIDVKRKDKIGITGALKRVGKDVGEYAEEHPIEAAATVYSGGVIGAGVRYGAKQIIKKLPELSKKIRTKLGSKKISKKEFKADEKLGKGAKQQAEEAKTPYEKVVTRKETVTKEVPGKKVKVKVKDKLGHDVKYKTGPKKGKPKYKTVAGPKVKKITKETRATFEPTWKAVAAQQAPKVKVGAGIVAGGILAKDQYDKMTIGAAQYDDKPVIGERSDEPTLGKITTDKKKKRELSGRGMLKQSINPATGGKLNGVSATDPKAKNRRKDWVGDDHRKNAWKTGGSNKTSTSVASNYTRTRDDRGTKVESTTYRASKPYVGSSQRNGSTKTTTTTKGKKRSTSSGIPSFTEMIHKQRKIRAKRY